MPRRRARVHRRTTTILTIGTLVFAASAAGPAPAATPPGADASRSPAKALALAALERTKRALGSRSVGGALRAAIGLLPGDVAAAPVGQAALPVPLAPGLAGPIAKLLAGVATAARLAEEAVPADISALEEGHRLALAAMARTDPGITDRAQAPTLIAAAQRHASSVDRVRLHSGALALADVIDEALSQLRDYGTRLPRVAGSVVGCDLADVPPALCVGGMGANTYTRDYALLVDLGGDDTYQNSAGGADRTHTLLTASVNLDVAGNDRYDATVPTPSGSIAVQGAVYLGGVGILVDGGGNDSYAATATAKTADSLWAQGYGSAGVGLLADLGGTDRYRVSQNSTAGQTYVSGQGNGVVGGTGVFLDIGQGPEDYVIEARPPVAVDDQGRLQANSSIVNGFGTAGVGGSGLWFDDGGPTTAALVSAGPTIPPEETRPQSSASFPSVNGFGVGVAAGVGTLISGPGTSSWSATAEASALRTRSANAFGFGEGFLAGLGTFHDAAGDDSYVVTASVRAAVASRIDESCTCAGNSETAMTGEALAEALGWAQTGAVGLLHDAGGNDRYVSLASTSAEAVVIDDHELPPPPDAAEPVGATAGALPGRALSQSLGVGVLGGSGFLLDMAGDDVYESRAVSEARAVATARHPETPVSSEAVASSADSQAEAFADLGGYGELTDLGGADRYVVVNESRASSVPEGGAVSGATSSSVQGSVNLGGEAFLRDVAAYTYDQDAFSALPPDPTCMGIRGEGVWVDCGTGIAGGSNL